MKRYPSRFSFPRGVLSALVLICTLALISPSGCKKPTEPSDRDQDTTSHNFSFEVFEIGDSGVLYDVAIVETDSGPMIYAVGELFLRDSSTGELDPTAYNLARWDGTNWRLLRIQFLTFCNQSSTGSYRTRAVFAFGPEDVWISSGSQIVRWNGLSQTTAVCIPVSVNKLWGATSNSVYAVGVGGGVARFDGSSWQELSSGTNLNLFDIHAVDAGDILIVGGEFMTYEGVLLRGNTTGFQVIEEGRPINTPEELFNPYFAGVGSTVWASDQNKVFFGGNLLYKYDSGTPGLVETFDGNSIGQNRNAEYFGFISQVRGNGKNDVVVVGERNTVRHFNGVSWRQLGMAYDPASSYTWLAVGMKGDIIVAVGRANSNAVAMILRR